MREEPTELFEKMRADLLAAQERVTVSRDAILRALAINGAVQEAQAFKVTNTDRLDVTRNNTVVPVAIPIEGVDLNGTFAVLNSDHGNFSISTRLCLHGNPLEAVALGGFVKSGQMMAVILSARNFEGGTELNQMMKWDFEHGEPEFLIGGEAQNPTAIRSKEGQQWEMGHIQPYISKGTALQAVHIQTPSYAGTFRSR